MSVIVVGFGDEPLLEECLRSVLRQLEPADELVLVDNGIRAVPSVERLTVVTPDRNTGFSGGCAAGVAVSRGEVLMFVNPDAVLRTGSVAALRECVADPSVGLAGGLVLLPGTRDTVNSVGLPVHLTGLSWCDGYGEPLADRHRTPRRLASVAGALFACRREVWDALGGMDTSYFMYHEDTDLSLRCHLAGLEVVSCPDAVATHAYEFSRNAKKMFHLERNRLLTVVGDYPTHLLVRVLPVLLVLEPLYFLIGVRDGWAREKLRAWLWLVRHSGSVSARRRRVQAMTVDPHALDDLLTPAVTQTQLEEPAAMAALNRLLTAYWWLVRPRPGERRHRRPDIAVLRTNPRDSSLARLLSIMVTDYRVLALVWDRTRDYECPVRSPNLLVRPSLRRGDYYRPRTLLAVAALQPWFLWQLLRSRPRAVHAIDLDTGLSGLVAARLLRVPFVYQCLDPYAASLPGAWPPLLARLAQRLENMVISHADLFVITDLGRMPQHEGASPRVVIELPNVPLRSLEPLPARGDTSLMLAYIGSLAPHRGLDVLVDTVGSMAADRVRLVLGGFGVLEDDLRRRSGQYVNVDFLGPVPYEDALDVLAGADALVQLGDPAHPALRWVSPNKVFESMALSRPVVVAESTLAADRAMEAGHGVPVPYNSPPDLRRVLIRLRDDPALRAQLGARGRATYETRWAPDAVVGDIRDAYRRLVPPIPLA